MARWVAIGGDESEKRKFERKRECENLKVGKMGSMWGLKCDFTDGSKQAKYFRRPLAMEGTVCKKANTFLMEISSVTQRNFEFQNPAPLATEMSRR